MAAVEPYIGSIDLWAPNFAPRGWAFCHGQLLAIAQYNAVFALIGTFYGGDGRTTFALPDLQGRVPVGVGQGYGLTPVQLGEKAGTETVSLTIAQMPIHDHPVQLTQPTYEGSVTPNAFTGRGGTASNDPIGNFPAPAPTGTNIYNTNSSGVMGSSPVTIQESTPGSLVIGQAGGSAPHYNMMPFLGVNYIFCLEGAFPSRN